MQVINSMKSQMEAYNKQVKNQQEKTVENKQHMGFFNWQDADPDREPYNATNRAKLDGYQEYLNMTNALRNPNSPKHKAAQNLFDIHDYDHERVVMFCVENSMNRSNAKEYVPRNQAFEQKIANCIKGAAGNMDDAGFAAKARAMVTASFFDKGYLKPTAAEVFDQFMESNPLTTAKECRDALAKVHEEHYGNKKMLQGLKLIKGDGNSASQKMQQLRNEIDAEDRARSDKQIIEGAKKMQLD